MPLTRRRFLHTAAAAAVAAPARASDSAFSFLLLGDLHFDKMEHHDLAWLERHHPGDLSQIKNYCRITQDITPRLLAAAHANASSSGAAFAVQVGDLVEGLCGSEELAVRQNAESVAFLDTALPGLPFLFTKGNHDITGDGAQEAFNSVFHPFLERQLRTLDAQAARHGACCTLQHHDALFCFFDAYDKASLDWLEAALDTRTARHCFVVIHPPVVPYGARATWHLYAAERDRSRREKLLGLLGRHRVIVLGGHIHRYNTLSRATPGGGRFAQFALSSIVNSAEVTAQTELSGVQSYNGGQIQVEPRHSPETAEARRAVYAAEAPQVRAFEYADLPGHAQITVDGGRVTAIMHRGISREVWRTADLTALLD